MIMHIADRRNKLFVFIICIILICIYLCFFNNRNYAYATYPKAIQGVLDLSNWDFVGNRPVELNGEWVICWNKLLEPEDVYKRDIPAKKSFINVPSRWKGQNIGRVKLSNNGCATYMLTVKTGNYNDILAIKTSVFISSYRLWINGKPVASGGQVSASGKDARGGYLPKVIPLMSENGTIRILLQISSYDYANGGFVNALLLGNHNQLENGAKMQIIFDMFLFGCIFIMGIYHFALFVLRKKDKSNIYFSFICFLVSLRTLLMGEGLFYCLFPGVSLEFCFKLAMISLSIGIIFLIMFIRELYPENMIRRFVSVSIFICLVYSFVTFITPDVINDYFVMPFEAGALIILSYLFYFVVQSVLRGKAGAWIIMLAFLALFLCGLNDIMRGMGLIKTPLFISSGLFVFILAQSLMLSMKFSKSFSTIEALSERLLSLDKLKDEFLANTSHELRTPLSGIIGIAQSMLKGAAGRLDAEMNNNLSLIISSGKRLSSLVDDLLDFSKLKNNDLNLQMKPVDIKQIIDMVLFILKPLADSKGLELRNTSGDNMLLVDGDENRLQQILLNLVGNAVKFTEEGYVAVSTAIKGGYVHVSVTDTGIGIPEERHEDIFKAFEQLDASETRKYGGTGLGLSISKQLVELYGGSIRVKSAPGKGSVFTFTIPVSLTYKEENMQETVPEHIVETANIPSITAENSRKDFNDSIMVVDDDPVNLKVLSNFLSLQGYAVKAETSGDRALKLLGRRQFDLVILDIMMPGISGYQICSKLRKTKSMSDMPVLMLTAKNRPGDITAGFNAGANDYLSKPFDEAELFARVKSLLTLRKLVKQEEILLRSEIRVLQAQIKPHFLFNALSTIQSCMRINPEKARTLIQDLSSYLRSGFSFRTEEDFIPFSTEMLHIRSYLSLEQARFGERLKVVYNIENDIECNIPPLVLQPMVENAVKHGLLPKRQGGTVRISASLKEYSLVLEVEDDGIGIPPEKIPSLLAGSNKNSGVGVRNVNARLEKIYGTGLLFESIPGKGTLVKIKIPLEKEVMHQLLAGQI